jgi:hypothetical protein
MAVHEPIPFARRKPLAETALCFGCTVGGLVGTALALHWLIGLIG